MRSLAPLQKIALLAVAGILIFLLIAAVLRNIIFPRLPQDWQTNVNSLASAFVLSIFVLAGLAQFTGLSIKDFLSKRGLVTAVHTTTPLVKQASSAGIALPATRDQQIVTEIAAPLSAYQEHPTADEIRTAIDNLPAFLQEQARRNYTGTRVKWNVKLSSVQPRQGDLVNVALYQNDAPPYLIVFAFDVTQYPLLRVMMLGDTFWVFGTINEVDPVWIRLVDCRLMTVDPAQVS